MLVFCWLECLVVVIGYFWFMIIVCVLLVWLVGGIVHRWFAYVFVVYINYLLDCGVCYCGFSYLRICLFVVERLRLGWLLVFGVLLVCCLFICFVFICLVLRCCRFYWLELLLLFVGWLFGCLRLEFVWFGFVCVWLLWVCG